MYRHRMKIRRHLALFIVLAISLTTILSSFSVSSATEGSLDFVISDIPESHVIEGVPYIGQYDGYTCHYCSIAMALQYNGLNITPFEIAYLCGAIHGSASGLKLLRNLRPLKFPVFTATFYPGEILAEGQADTRFLGQILGLFCEDWVPSIRISDKRCWDEYYTKLKQYLIRDIPVVTGIDPTAWPLYQKAKNMSKTPLISFGGHSIIIVGFNETNQTICFNDPMATLYPTLKPEEGKYAWVNLSDFRLAVSRTYWSLWDFSYSILAYEKITDPPSKETIYRMAHERNIKKLKGISSAYDYNICSRNYRYLGINAFKHLKKELQLYQKGLFLAIYCLRERFVNRLDSFGAPVSNLNNSVTSQYYFTNKIAEFLLNNDTTPLDYKYETELLIQESSCWKEILNLTTEMDTIIREEPIMKAMALSKPILNRVCIFLDNIITLEQAIIDGPAEN